MGCCLYFSQGSRTWLALLVPIFAIVARFSSDHGTVLFPTTFIFLSAIFLLIISKRKPIKSATSLLKAGQAKMDKREAAAKGKGEEILMASQDLYSESESMDQRSSISSEDHSSDMEWPYNMGQRVDCSDGSISDEESLIEIAIPSGQFVKDDLRWNVKCCKLSQESMFEKDFWAEIYEMNEEDNLIEIDINIGSTIKCSSF